MKAALTAAVLTMALSSQAQQYKPTWQSLETHPKAPEWFRDAKFGIYCHWGPYSVPAFGDEWYPRNMFIKGSRENLFHIQKYGDPSKFGYDGFVPMFTAEKFNADEWADLFLRSGAKFAGPVAEHHDGFAMWDSKLTPWNAVDMGPKQDIVGKLEKAIRKRGMKFIATFHHSRNASWEMNGQWTGHYDHIRTDYPDVLKDPKKAFLYGYMPHDKFVDMWKGKLYEVIDKYHPDLLWFDFSVNEIPDKDQREFLAYYFNHSPGQEVLVTCKNFDFPKSVTVEDFEKGRLEDTTEDTWLTDDTISWGSWSYTTDLELKDTGTIVKTLADIVSKNGELLLNASPKADGSFPEDQKKVLYGVGDWLKINGEAIYNTRPWLIYGEGPTKMAKGGHFVGKVDYTEKDIRYTQSKDGKTLYVIILGKPKPGPIQLKSVRLTRTLSLPSAELLGRPGRMATGMDDNQRLTLLVPEIQGPDQPAYVFKITNIAAGLAPDARFGRPSTIRLAPESAVIEGVQAKAETSEGVGNIGFWDNPTDKLHWLAYIPKAGAYDVRGSFAAGRGDSAVELSVEGQSAILGARGTNDWRKPKYSLIARFKFDKPGVYHFVLKPADPAKWRPVNVFGIEIAPHPANDPSP